MNKKTKYIKALDELSKIIGWSDSSISINKPLKISKLGLFIYDSKGEIKSFDRTMVNLGVIINRKL